MSCNLSIIQDEFGEYDDWIELYNYGDDTINLKGLYLTDSRNNLTKFQISIDTLIAPDKYVILWADDECNQGPLHTSFKLSGEGECIYISDHNLVILDSVIFNIQTANYSFGRLKNNFLNWNYFVSPSPGMENPTSGLLKVIAHPTASHLSGYYNVPFCLELVHYDKEAIIRYTLNGDTPDETSPEYTQCISIDKTTVVRYKSFKVNCVPGMTQTRTFFFEEPGKDLDVIAIAINNNDLTGPSGIFSTRNKEVEKAVHIEYFGNDEKMKFNIDGGIRLHSPKSNPQLSLCLFARSDYGFDNMDYQIFKNKDIHSFNRLILRNGGNDGTATKRPLLTHFRDGLHHVLFEQSGNIKATSAYRPVNVYINGQYFGIYNAREKIDKGFVEANYNFNGEIDLLERTFGFPRNRCAIEGTFQILDSVNSFMDNNDISVDENYEVAANLVDIDNYIDYWIHEVYIGNFDWLVNNIKIYRQCGESGKLNWILWDTDHGSGLPYQNYGKPEWATLKWSLSTDQTRTGGGAENILQRNFIKNHKFKIRFINRYADLLNAVYKYGNIENVIDSIKLMLQDDMEYHCERWGIDYASWMQAIGNMKNYHEVRAGHVRKDIMNCFLIDAMHTVTLKTNDQNAGIIKINTISPKYKANEWQGIYFSGIPVTIEAIPHKGYKFDRWNNASFSDSDIQIIDLTSDSVFEAVFTPLPKLLDSSKIIINEISYANPGSDDWIEITNMSGLNMSLKNWKIMAGNSIFNLGDIEIKKNKFLVIASNKKGLESTSNSTVIHLDNFELTDTGCSVKLVNANNKIIDEVQYRNTSPWPSLASGNGFTLELADPALENSHYDNWRSSVFIGGTPGQGNSIPNDDLKYIAINEFMALNDDYYYDEFGESDDWVEIYNKSNRIIDIRGLFISDNDNNSIKYQIQNTIKPITINPGGYIVLWADGEVGQGPLHMSFKLEGDGEEIAIFRNNGYEILEIDKINFGLQSEFYSFGREYDGVGNQYCNWSFLSPTPGNRNQITRSGTSITSGINSESEFIIYPIPAVNDLYIKKTNPDKGNLSVEVFNILGVKQIVDLQYTGDSTINIRLDRLQTGLYIISISDESGNRFINKITISK